MSIVQLDFVAGDYAAGGPGGHINMIDEDGSIESLVIPDQLVPLLERPSFAQQLRGSRATLYIDGGLNDPAMLTDQRMLLRRYIRPMTEVLVEDATPEVGQIGLEQIAASTGPTGACVFYLRWEDSTHNRLSGFSAASPTLALDGTEAVKFYAVPPRPTPDDFPVDKVQVWVSRNGAAKRRLARRDAGAATFTITETVEYEAETVEGLQPLPRCTYNAIYHDRLWTSGDSQNPDRIYYSPAERLSEFAGGYLVTRQGEAVVGMVVVRDVLVILCAKSSYTISGYSEDDFEVRTLEPSIGCVTHHGIKMVHDVAIIPSHQGLFACTGTAMHFLDGGYATLWAELYTVNPLAFELGFAVNDERAKVYKFFEEDVTVSAAGVPTYGDGRYWVFDYKNFSQQEGGGYAPPLLSFDIHAARPKCAAMVAAPGGRAGNLYTAFTDIAAGTANRIVQENQWTELDVVGARTTVIQPAIVAWEPDGGPNDGLSAVEAWLLVHYQSIASWLLEMCHGPERAMIRSEYSWVLNTMFGIPLAQVPASGGGREITPAWSSWTAADVQNFSPSALPFKVGLVGEGFGPRLSVVDAVGLVWSGWGCTVDAGKAYLAEHV